MNVAFDYDGVISANWNHYFQLAFDLKRSGHTVYIISCANTKRQKEVEKSLENFPYTRIIFRTSEGTQTNKWYGTWKKEALKMFDIDLWFDNEVKIYEQEGLDFSDIKTEIVRV